MSFLESINGGQPLQAGDCAVIVVQGAMFSAAIMFAWKGRKEENPDD